MKRWIAIILMLCMVLSLTACRSTNTTTDPVLNPTQAGTTKATTTVETTTTTTATETTTQVEELQIEQVKESWESKTDPVTFTWASSEHDGTTGRKWADDEISRRITDLTGVKLLLTFGSENGTGEGGNFYDVLAASGEWTDLIYVRTEYDVRPLVQSGDTVALDELAAQYCPDFWDSLEEKEILFNTESDGHVYVLRNSYINDRYYDDPTYPIAYPYPLWIRMDLLKKLDAEMPTSVEELEELLRRAKEKAGGSFYILTPLVASGVTELPMANWMGVYNSIDYLGRSNLQWDQESKMIVTSMSDPDWYEYLMEMNRWHRDGLITLTEYEDGLIEGLGTYSHAQGDSIRSFARVAYATNVDHVKYYLRYGEEAQTDPKLPVKMITEPLTWQGEDQMKAVPMNFDYGTYGGGLMISRTCHDKERAILFYQFLRSDDGYKLTHWGVEGIHYNLDENDHVVMTEGNVRAADREHSTMYGLYDLSLESDSVVGYWAMVDNPMMRGRYAASPVGAEGNPDIIRLRTDLIEAGVKYKEKVVDQTILPMDKVIPQEGDSVYEEYVRLYRMWKDGINEMVCADTIELAEEYWAQLQKDLKAQGLDLVEQSLTFKFMEVMERYQAAGYFEDVKLR